MQYNLIGLHLTPKFIFIAFSPFTGSNNEKLNKAVIPSL
jgi:hypothetical protein